ncbi:MAG TPA: hypothetical protein VFA21_13285 [Pyrinomonadaceae bacterium]|jgi:hypothetical protein|nr:hypothetical protein [Pyrinomonadaceae bacterium]
MRGTIRNILITSVLLLLCSLSSLYVGSQESAAAPPDANILAQQFGADPGDGWLLAGGFLLLLALAFAFAGAMLWAQEREG